MKKHVYLIKTLTKDPGENQFHYCGWFACLSSLQKAQSELINSYEVNNGYNLKTEFEHLKSGERTMSQMEYTVNIVDENRVTTGKVMDIRKIIEKLEVR